MKKSILVVLCALLAVFISSFKLPVSIFENKTISDFKLRNTEGKYVSLSDYKNAKGFIVIFTCNHCPFAKLYTQRMNEMKTKYGVLNVPLIAINSMDTAVYEDESFAMMKTRAKVGKFNFQYLHDVQQNVGKNFGAEHTPKAYVIWKEGNTWKIKYSGLIDDNGAEPKQVKNPYLQNAVDQLLAGKEVTTPSPQSMGCAIYYR